MDGRRDELRDVRSVPHAEGTTQRLVPRRAGARRAGARDVARTGDEPAALHARGVGGILDIALEILVARFAPCVAVAAAFLLPLRVIGEALPTDVRMLWGVSYYLPEHFTTAFVCSLVGGHLMGRRVGAGEAIREGALAMPGMVALAIVQGVAAVGLVCLCVFPVLFAYWVFAVIPAVYVLERHRLVRDAGLARGSRWGGGVALSVTRGIRLVLEPAAFARWLGWSVVGFLAVVYPLQMSSGMLDHPAVRMHLNELLPLDGRAVWYTLSAIGAVFAGIGTAYLAILKTVYYLDQRVRREGFDLELLLEAPASRHGRGEPDGVAAS